MGNWNVILSQVFRGQAQILGQRQGYERVRDQEPLAQGGRALLREQGWGAGQVHERDAPRFPQKNLFKNDIFQFLDRGEGGGLLQEEQQAVLQGDEDWREVMKK